MKSIIILLLAVVQGVQARKFIRFPCAQLVIDRLDSVVQPGKIPSQHMHQITGGNAFNATMSSDVAPDASCSTCTFDQNRSNYWTQVLYFRARNGTFKKVAQISDEGYTAANGGMIIYYALPSDPTIKITAFPPGFRMIAGNPFARNASAGGKNSYHCYTSPGFIPNPPDAIKNDTTTFPLVPCPGGLRHATFFKQCWDGVTLDPPDHSSHVAWFQSGDLDNGTCPSTHPVRIPQIFIEAVWDTSVFPTSEWPEDGSQPFVWSQGDPTGYGAHADYVFGWVGDTLQRATDARCDSATGVPVCSQLTDQSYTAMNNCVVRQKVLEDQGADDWLDTLPGGLTVTYE